MSCPNFFSKPCPTDFSCGVYGSTGSVGITGPVSTAFIENPLVCSKSVIVLSPSSNVNQTSYSVYGPTGGGFNVRVNGGTVSSVFTFNYIGSNPCS